MKEGADYPTAPHTTLPCAAAGFLLSLYGACDSTSLLKLKFKKDLYFKLFTEPMIRFYHLISCVEIFKTKSHIDIFQQIFFSMINYQIIIT
jgi:hypothetical protein